MGGACRARGSVPAAGWLRRADHARLSDEDKVIYTRAVALLKKMKDLNVEQKKFLEQWDETPDAVRLEGIQDATERKTPNLGGNTYFGF